MGDARPRLGMVGARISRARLIAVLSSASSSALNPAGNPADDIAGLFWLMTAGAAIIWVAVLALAIYVVRAEPNGTREAQAKRLILAGAAIPTVVLAALLAYGLTLLPRVLRPAPPQTLRVWVHGEQWWWRVRYEPAGVPAFVLANEIRLPVGRPVEFMLESDNVIHSFWVPSLAGKMDLIPGRTNRLLLRPTRTGTFAGICAEFCGRAHAKMRFTVIVLPVDEFERWVADQGRVAAAPTAP
jgi:cytochrome c oxidase subunit II